MADDRHLLLPLQDETSIKIMDVTQSILSGKSIISQIRDFTPYYAHSFQMDDSDGYFRRFLIINCPNKVADKDRDTQLESKLQADDVRAAIFNWMLEGRKALMQNDCKIAMSQSVMDMRADMKADSNSARRWIREFGLKAGYKEGEWKSLKEWMAVYQQYCKDYGESPKTAKGVSKVFDDLGFPKKRTGTGTWYCIAYDEPGVAVAEDLSGDLEVGSLPKLPF